ncbi:MAG TPA: HTTM domain-containing protein [Acidimicrobiia bacterium]|nr:HTTM domain-containing protein [Acidimicrobiia bacterium]
MNGSSQGKFLCFFFGPISVLPLALLRIVSGALTLIWALFLYSDVEPLLTHLRVEPTRDILWWQLFPDLPLLGVRLLCLSLVGASFLVMIGAWTRLAAWSAFLITLALQRYNPAAFNGGDLIMRGVIQLAVALGPSGAYLSIDSVRRGQWNKLPPQIEAWPIRFVQLHISMGYLLTFYLKTRGHTWFDGTALWYALNIEDLARFNVPDVLIVPPFGAILTWLAVATEAFVGVGVWWHRTLPLALMAGIGLHVGIALTLEIGFFSLVMITSYLAFVPGAAFERLLSRSRVRRDRVPFTPVEAPTMAP